MTANALPEWPPGHIVAGKYTVQALLSRTAWSRSYQAITEPNREIVLRVFHPDPALERAIGARMPKIAKLEPHALPILEVGRDPVSGLDFIATARSRHPSLASLVELCPLTLSEGVSFAESLGRALDAAHDIDVKHLALTPQSIFVGPAPECSVQLSDFEMTPHRPFVLSDALWLSPEQLEGQPATQLTDVYLTALVVFFALTGQP
jgi:serine/threonine protein kinase